MYEKQNFREVGKIPAGELVVPFPGTDMVQSYDEGMAYVNQDNSIGYIDLLIRSLEMRENDSEPVGQLGRMGLQMREQFANSSMQQALADFLEGTNHYMLYSQTNDGLTILTAPGFTGNTQIHEETIRGLILAEYSSHGRIPGLEELYNLHTQAIGSRALLCDETVLRDQTLHLPAIINDSYKKAIDLAMNYMEN